MPDKGSVHHTIAKLVEVVDRYGGSYFVTPTRLGFMQTNPAMFSPLFDFGGGDWLTLAQAGDELAAATEPQAGTIDHARSAREIVRRAAALGVLTSEHRGRRLMIEPTSFARWIDARR